MYSLDYRLRVLKIKKEEGLNDDDTCKRFGIKSRKTLYNWKQKITPKTKRNKPATKIDMKALEEDVRKNPDKYQYERAKKFKVTAWAIGVALKRLGISYKKNSQSPQGRRRGTYTIPNKNNEASNKRP